MMDTGLLAKLVEFNTASQSGYAECAEFVRENAERAGFKTAVYNMKPPYHKPKPNVVIELDAGAEQTLLLATHYDVVPAGDGWKYPPFRLTIKGGRAYGRGAADDKGGILSAFSAMKSLRERGSSKMNVKLLVTCDEEVGGEDGLGFLMRTKRGGRFLIDGNAAILIDAGPHAYIGSSGRVSGSIRARESPQRLVSLVAAVVDYSKERDKMVSRFRDTASVSKIRGRISVTMLNLRGGAIEYAKAGVKSNIIPGECRVKLKGQGEVVVHGRQGHAGYPHMFENSIVNALPLLRNAAALSDGEGECEIVFDLRTTPEESLGSAVDEFKAYLRKIDTRAQLHIREKAEGYLLQKRHPFVRIFAKALGEREVYASLGATDVQFFSRRGIPSICFGPIADDSSIHGKDEFVRMSDLELVSNVLVKLCEGWSL